MEIYRVAAVKARGKRRRRLSKPESEAVGIYYRGRKRERKGEEAKARNSGREKFLEKGRS